MPKDALRALIEELRAIERMPADDPIQRRIAIRSSFAAVEALAAAMMAAAAPEISRLAVEAGECSEERHRLFFAVCALSDMSYQLTDRGEISIQPSRAKLANKVLFAINMLAKANGVRVEPRQTEGWEEFQKAIKIRNRITHPKGVGDLLVSADDYGTTVKALQWLIRCNHRASGGTTY